MLVGTISLLHCLTRSTISLPFSARKKLINAPIKPIFSTINKTFMRVIEFSDVDELTKAYEGYQILEEFPDQRPLGKLRSNSVYVIKECMLDVDFDQAIL